MTNRANVYIKRGKYSDKIADNKIKRGFFCKILVFLTIKLRSNIFNEFIRFDFQNTCF